MTFSSRTDDFFFLLSTFSTPFGDGKKSQLYQKKHTTTRHVVLLVQCVFFFQDGTANWLNCNCKGISGMFWRRNGDFGTQTYHITTMNSTKVKLLHLGQIVIYLTYPCISHPSLLTNHTIINPTLIHVPPIKPLRSYSYPHPNTLPHRRTHRPAHLRSKPT